MSENLKTYKTYNYRRVDILVTRSVFCLCTIFVSSVREVSPESTRDGLSLCHTVCLLLTPLQDSYHTWKKRDLRRNERSKEKPKEEQVIERTQRTRPIEWRRSRFNSSSQFLYCIQFI